LASLSPTSRLGGRRDESLVVVVAGVVAVGAAATGGVRAHAGPKYELVFTDRLLVSLVYLRTGLTREALGVIYQVRTSTIGRAIGDVRPLSAERGFVVPQRPDLRLRILADVFAYAETHWSSEPRRPTPS
jgi:hypothetical protein